jgi:signal transduction histidine kinase
VVREAVDIAPASLRRGGRRRCAFPAAFLPTAFERFTRADVARGRGGSGLGLAIVAAIAQAHGGRAGAHDAGGGADVWVRLPSRPGSEPAAGP